MIRLSPWFQFYVMLQELEINFVILMVDHRIFDGSNLGLNVGSNLAVDRIAVGLKINH